MIGAGQPWKRSFRLGAKGESTLCAKFFYFPKVDNLSHFNNLSYKMDSARRLAIRSFNLRQLGPMRRFKPLPGLE